MNIHNQQGHNHLLKLHILHFHFLNSFLALLVTRKRACSLIMFLLLSKTQFAPWEVYLQHGKTGVMLHFYLESSSESLPTKKLTIFCPFLFGAPYQVSFSVYALGKKKLTVVFSLMTI